MSVGQQGQADNIRDTVWLKIESSCGEGKGLEGASEVTHLVAQGSRSCSIDETANTSDNPGEKTWIIENVYVRSTI